MKFLQKNLMYLALVLLTYAMLASSAVMTTEDASASNMTTTAAPKSVIEVAKEIEGLVTYVTKQNKYNSSEKEHE
ncbi:hypothetical protein JTE90_005002 [Oedothorax gibbosus]|uniref:Secreted protein n=1 Tax=Oedothorax gibbosus TaxID=931172 RepID=A0AAV6VB50_9ARAC|nr:hypothetical protein JTE90_005002 [Oedothorax gibbosus]